MSRLVKIFHNEKWARLLFSFALAEFAIHWLIIKWYVTTTYHGSEADFILNGFPLPFQTDWGIVARFGNSFDVAFSFLNYFINFLFFSILFFLLTSFLRKAFQNMKKAFQIFIMILIIIAVLHESLFWFFTTMGDFHPWFDNKLNIIKVEFWNSKDIETIMRQQN